MAPPAGQEQEQHPLKRPRMIRLVETSEKMADNPNSLCKSNLRGLRMSHNPTPSLELAVAMSLGSTGLNITLWKAEG